MKRVSKTAAIGEHKSSSQIILSTNQFPSDSESLSSDQTPNLTTSSLPTLHIPWGGISLVSMQHNEMDVRCVHCSTRPSSSVLHLLGPGAVLLEDRLDALQHNCSFIRNNSWPKKVGNSRIYRGRSSLRIPRDGDTGLVYSSRDRTVYSPQDCADTPPELRLGRLSNDTNENGDSNSPFQSISEQELHNRQEMRYSNGNGHSYFSTPRPLKRSSLNLLTRDTNSNLSLDEISCRMHDRIRRSTPNLANNSPLIRVKHGHRLEGVDGKEFKTRMSKIESWFNEFSDVQRNVVLRKLFPLFTTAQVQLLITTMEPFIDPFCMHNCQVC